MIGNMIMMASHVAELVMGLGGEQCLAAYICRNIYSICPAQPVIKTDSIASQTIKGDNVSFLKLHVDNHSNKRGAADNSDGAV